LRTSHPHFVPAAFRFPAAKPRATVEPAQAGATKPDARHLRKAVIALKKTETGILQPSTERRLFQCLIAILALLPLFAGVAGVVEGPAFLGVTAPWPADLDSHLRFLSGVFLAMAVAWYACIPDIERKGSLFGLLALFTFSGGLARLVSLAVAGPPSAGHLLGQCMEVVIVPLLVLWQRRIARHYP